MFGRTNLLQCFSSFFPIRNAFGTIRGIRHSTRTRKNKTYDPRRTGEFTVQLGDTKIRDFLLPVIMLQDVDGIGYKGDIKRVKASIIRTDLFPNQKAIYATPKNRALYKQSKTGRDLALSTEDQALSAYRKIIYRLKCHHLVIGREGANEIDESCKYPVTEYHIRQATAYQLFVELHPSHLFMDSNITMFGQYAIPLNLRDEKGDQIEVSVKVKRVERPRTFTFKNLLAVNPSKYREILNAAKE